KRRTFTPGNCLTTNLLSSKACVQPEIFNHFSTNSQQRTKSYNNMKKVLIYSTCFLAVIVLIAWKLKSNKAENAEITAIVKESSSGAVPVLVSNVSHTKFEN